MPRHNSSGIKLLDGNCTIQKHVHSSSSSTNSLLKNHSLNWTVLVAKRRASTTPVPLWRVRARSPHLAAVFGESSQHLPSHDDAKENQVSVSAQKLGNALWILKNAPSPKIKEAQDTKSAMKCKKREKTTRCIGVVSFPHHLYKHAHSPLSKLCNPSRSSSHKRTLSPTHQKFGSMKHNPVYSDLTSEANLMEIESFQRLVSQSSLLGSMKCFKDLQNGLVKSKELVKILIHLCGQRKQKISAISLARALYCQLDEAVAQVDQLIHHKDSDHGEIYRLVRQFMEEKEMWKKKKQEGIRIAVQSAIEELETERKLRIKAESKNEKLRLELTQMNTSLVNASKQLDSERRTRQMIEQVCGQMIRRIGDNKAEVEELKRESAKAREELEMKRQMLQLADEWREERVHMKLAEAKHQFEEKNAAANQLRHELESFLAVKRSQDPFDGPWDLADDHESDCLRVRQMVHPSRSMSATNLIMDRDTNGEKDQEENNVTDSEDSDLHSIELNMDNNNNGYSWSYVHATIEKEGELALAIEYDEMSTKCGKVSDTEEKVMTEGIKEKIIRKFLQLNNNLARGRPVDNSSALDQSGEQYVPVEVPQDQNLVGSSITLPFGLPSSTKQLSRERVSQNKAEQVCLGSKVSEMVKAISESDSMASLGRTNVVHSPLQIAPIQ